MMTIPLITHPDYSFPFPAKHRFPMEKFSLLHRHLIDTGLATEANTYRPGTAKPALLELAHCPIYLQQLRDNQLSEKAQRRLGLPWSEGLIKRTFISPNGTFLTASLALKEGIACHLAGGTHHAHYNEGSGFCAINDLAVAALGIVSREKAKGHRPPRILIFDVDVHQGDGTATILANHPQIFTCSVHCEKNFPARKARSHLDVNVSKGCRDDEYLQLVKHAFEQALTLSKPDLVLYDAGVDVYEHDPLGLLAISLEGIKHRDRHILQRCHSLGLPVATVIGGGYDRDQMALAQRHAIVIQQAFEVFSNNAGLV